MGFGVSAGFYARWQNASCVIAMAWVSVHPSHCCIVSKLCKLGSQNFHHGLPPGL